MRDYNRNGLYIHNRRINLKVSKYKDRKEKQIDGMNILLLIFLIIVIIAFLIMP